RGTAVDEPFGNGPGLGPLPAHQTDLEALTPTTDGDDAYLLRHADGAPLIRAGTFRFGLRATSSPRVRPRSQQGPRPDSQGGRANPQARAFDQESRIGRQPRRFGRRPPEMSQRDQGEQHAGDHQVRSHALQFYGRSGNRY